MNRFFFLWRDIFDVRDTAGDMPVGSIKMIAFCLLFGLCLLLFHSQKNYATLSQPFNQNGPDPNKIMAPDGERYLENVRNDFECVFQIITSLCCTEFSIDGSVRVVSHVDGRS